MRRTLIALLALTGLVVAAPAALAHGHAGPSGKGLLGANEEIGGAKAIILSIDKLQPKTGRLEFTIEPEGFTFEKVPYKGSKNAAGQGHAHIYAKVPGKKATYIGWTGSGATSWTDKGMLKPGTTYRVFAVFSENDHTEDRAIMSNWIKVDF